MNIVQLIKGDDLIESLEDKCSFRPIKNDEVSNIYRSVIDWPKTNIYVVNNFYVLLNHVQIRGQKLIT